MKNLDFKYFLALVIFSMITYLPFHFLNANKLIAMNLEKKTIDHSRLTDKQNKIEATNVIAAEFYTYQ